MLRNGLNASYIYCRWILKFGMQKILMKTILSPQRVSLASAILPRGFHFPLIECVALLLQDYWCVAVVQLLSLMFRDDRCMEDMYNVRLVFSFEIEMVP